LRREKAVCNASPLIFLAKIQKLQFLDKYELYIPFQVEAEILRGLKNKKEDAKQIIKYLKNNDINPVNIKPLRDLPDFLGSGERAVITLAVRENIKRVFIDEARARIVARFKGLNPKGTLGILWDAYKAGIIDRETTESLSLDLIQKGYRIREEVFIEFLKRLKQVNA
jgi:predicted nucleic acid-binding protein